jgi:twinkle protein
MSEFRRIATTYNVHIAVVIHPRKTEDNEDIGIHSIYGTSKATQEADNIWVIQNRDGFKIFDIKKNRFDGDVGRVAIGFNKDSKSFFELKKKELEGLFNGEKTIHEIIDEREVEKEEQKKQQGGEENWLNLDSDYTEGDERELVRPTPKRKY